MPLLDSCPKCGGRWTNKSGFKCCVACSHVSGSECSDWSYRSGRVFHPGADAQIRTPRLRRTPETHRDELEFE